MIRRIFYIAMMVFVMLIISSCQSSDHLLQSKDVPSRQIADKLTKQFTAKFFGNNQISPLPVKKGEFSMVSEWLDNETILYETNSNGNANIYRFNIYTGKNELFYTSDSQIVSISANQNHSYFLIRTAPSTYEAGLIILDKSGHALFTWKVGSYDLLVTWNPFMKTQLYVTTFLSDWSFQTYIIDANHKAVTESNLPIPFIQWVDSSDIAYLKWNENEPTFSAPLYKVNVKSKKEEKVFDNISFFSAFSDALMTVEVKDKTNAQYTFYDLTLKNKIAGFSTPILAKYSDWFIPDFDYVSVDHLFYTFRPYHSGSYDEYKQKYDLISFSPESGKKKVVMSQIDHRPIKFSPNGKLCLYGFYFENIINLNNKKVTPLIHID